MVPKQYVAFVSTTMPQLEGFHIYVTLKKKRARQHLSRHGHACQRDADLAKFPNSHRSSQRFKPQQGPLEFGGRLLTGCPRAPNFTSCPLCMGGGRIQLRQTPDGEAKERIDQHQHFFLAGCTDIGLASFRVPASLDCPGLWDEINMSRAWPSPRSAGVMVDQICNAHDDYSSLHR